MAAGKDCTDGNDCDCTVMAADRNSSAEENIAQTDFRGLSKTTFFTKKIDQK